MSTKKRMGDKVETDHGRTIAEGVSVRVSIVASVRVYDRERL